MNAYLKTIEQTGQTCVSPEFGKKFKENLLGSFPKLPYMLYLYNMALIEADYDYKQVEDKMERLFLVVCTCAKFLEKNQK